MWGNPIVCWLKPIIFLRSSTKFRSSLAVVIPNKIRCRKVKTPMFIQVWSHLLRSFYHILHLIWHSIYRLKGTSLNKDNKIARKTQRYTRDMLLVSLVELTQDHADSCMRNRRRILRLVSRDDSLFAPNRNSFLVALMAPRCRNRWILHLVSHNCFLSSPNQNCFLLLIAANPWRCSAFIPYL